MAPTPSSTSHQHDMIYTCSGFTHRIQLPCNAVNVSGTYYLKRSSPFLDRLASDCADDFAALWAPWYANTATMTQYVLQEYNAGSFLPVEQAGMSVAGTDGGTNRPAGQVTVTFRDTEFNSRSPRARTQAHNGFVGAPMLSKLSIMSSYAAIAVG